MGVEVQENVLERHGQIMSVFRSILLPLMALGLALTGQWLLLKTDFSPLMAAILFIAAVNAYILFLIHWPQAALVPEPVEPLDVAWRPIVRESGWRAVLVINSLVLAVFSYGRFSGNALDKGFWPWIASITLFLIAFIRVPAGGAAAFYAALRAWWRGLDKRVLLLLSAIILLATFFRFYRLSEVPAEMTSDHAEKILDVQDVLDGKWPIFFPRNTGREMFQFYLTAGIIRLTGLPNSHLSLKTGTAIFGLLAVPFTFLLGRFLYGNMTGLLATFFLAVSHWHVAITRVGLRFPFTAAFVTPLIFFLLRALKNNRRNDWLLAGLFLGVGLHTYTAMRIAPLLCAALVGLKLLLDGFRKKTGKPIEGTDAWTMAFWTNGFLAFYLATLLLLPLIRYTLEDPQGVWIRSMSRAQGDTALTLPEAATQFLENLKNAMLMFNYQGDVVAVNTIPDEPVLGIVSGGLLILGLAYLVWHLLAHGDVRSAVLLICVFFLLLPSILSLAYPHENPSVVRTGGAIPFVMIMAAIPLATILLRLRSGSFRVDEPLAALVVTSLILLAVFDNYTWYFADYDQQYRRSIWNATEMGAVLQAFEEEGGDLNQAYHIPYPHWVDTRNIGINAGHVRWNNAVNDPQTLYDHVTLPLPQIYFLNPADTGNLETLLELFPNGRIERYNSTREGKNFIIFRVPDDAGN